MFSIGSGFFSSEVALDVASSAIEAAISASSCACKSAVTSLVCELEYVVVAGEGVGLGEETVGFEEEATAEVDGEVLAAGEESDKTTP